jgi:hypothetical protein
MTDLPQEALLTTKDVQQLVNLKSVPGVNALVKKYQIPIIYLGPRVKRFRRSDIEAVLTRMTATTTE